jgi:hypothetical protein
VRFLPFSLRSSHEPDQPADDRFGSIVSFHAIGRRVRFARASRLC